MLEREMFEAYVKQADAVTFGGKPLLTWDELGEDSQICWKAAASVCADEIERLREALQMWVKFWENDQSIDVTNDQWLAEEAMEATRQILRDDNV